MNTTEGVSNIDESKLERILDSTSHGTLGSADCQTRDIVAYFLQTETKNSASQSGCIYQIYGFEKSRVTENGEIGYVADGSSYFVENSSSCPTWLSHFSNGYIPFKEAIPLPYEAQLSNADPFQQDWTSNTNND